MFLMEKKFGALKFFVLLWCCTPPQLSAWFEASLFTAVVKYLGIAYKFSRSRKTWHSFKRASPGDVLHDTGGIQIMEMKSLDIHFHPQAETELVRG